MKKLTKKEKRVLEIIWNDGYGSIGIYNPKLFNLTNELQSLQRKKMISKIGAWYYYEVDKPFNKI